MPTKTLRRADSAEQQQEDVRRLESSETVVSSSPDSSPERPVSAGASPEVTSGQQVPGPPGNRAGELVEEAWNLVQALSAAQTLPERIQIYKHTTRRHIFAAAARWPERMPELNGEIEYIALLSADLG